MSVQFCVLMNLLHALAPEYRKVVKLQSKLCDLNFCIKISSFRTSMLQKSKFNNLPLEFCKPIQRLRITSIKTIFSQIHIDILWGQTSYEGIWGCLLHLPPRNCRLLLNYVFLRWWLKTLGQVSTVQFNCKKTLLMKPEVNQG